jgi:nitric oxide reductase activation protein
MDTKQIALNMDILELEESLVTSTEEDTLSLTSPIDPSDLDIEELKKGDVKDALGMLVTDLEHGEVDLDAAEDDDQRKAMAEPKPMQGKISRQVREEFRFLYDEWDHVIEDYRRRWCTLFEIRDLDEEPEFVQDTLSDHKDLANKVRRQLNKLKPELLRKVRGMPDGDDMDLEKTVEAVVDRKMGLSPSENIYVQRQRKDRDVSALFLLDMSASTDDLIPDPDAGPEFKPEDYEDDDFLSTFYAREQNTRDTDKGKRIIDLEKESVILMAEALEELGDNYSICGFSGYGRERIDYFLCKDFKDPYDIRAKGKIGGIKPCRSTRMGPAIRHATRSLVKTESRIKAMIIISDGYPQDFDYGKDRNSRDYGVRDTTKALNEARQQGVQTFCLTVDPSGHDYLREMCPDQQYMVIQDIAQLPDELSKVYRSLTG